MRGSNLAAEASGANGQGLECLFLPFEQFKEGLPFEQFEAVCKGHLAVAHLMFSPPAPSTHTHFFEAHNFISPRDVV